MVPGHNRDGEARDAPLVVNRPPTADFDYAATPVEEQFARLAALNPDLEACYLEAGFPPHPNQFRKALALRGQPRIQERIQYFASLIAHKHDIRESRILNELAAMAFADPAEFFQPGTHRSRALSDIPAHARAAIKAINVSERETVDAEGNITTSHDAQIQMADKFKALDALSKIKALYPQAPSAAGSSVHGAPTVIIDFSGSTNPPTPSITTIQGPTIHEHDDPDTRPPASIDDLIR